MAIDCRWTKLYREIAQYILDNFKNNHKGLVDTLKAIGETKGLKDQVEKGKDIELQDIDPFSFFSFFNKYSNPSNRKLRFQKLKEYWKLNSVVPDEYPGVPSSIGVNFMFFAFSYERKENDINILWEAFEKSFNGNLDENAFNAVCNVKQSAITSISQALFWVNPDTYLPFDRHTRTFVDDINVNDWKTYQIFMDKVKEKYPNMTNAEISDRAWENSHNHEININEEMNMNSEDRQYWTYSPGEGAEFWGEFFENGEMRIGWDDVGDLTQYKSKKDIIAKGLTKINALACYEFCNAIKTNDIIYAKEGTNYIIGVGIVKSDYFFDDSKEYFKHCRKVKWIKNGNWPTKTGISRPAWKTLTNITRYSEMRNALEKLVNGGSTNESFLSEPENIILYGPPGTGKTYKTITMAAHLITGEKYDSSNYKEALDIFNKNKGDKIEFITFHQNYSYEDFIQGLRPDTDLDSPGNLTFNKLDGVFKRIADRALKNWNHSEKQPKPSFEEVFKEFVKPLLDEDVDKIIVDMKKTQYSITLITEHSIVFKKSSGKSEHTLSIATLKRMYEAGENNIILGGLQPYYNPLLKKLLELARKTEVKTEGRSNYVIIIDEINRANISRVFGELITLIEVDKRSHGDIPLSCTLPSGDKFEVPSNLHIIGTMNTADKSIALLDVALRRRFEFEAMYPDYEIEGLKDREILKKINENIIEKKSHDFQIGHSYFMGEADLTEKMNKKVIPLLMEYFMNDENEVAKILKDAGLNVNEKSWPIKIVENND